MSRKRRQHSDQFKFKVALEASKGIKTLNELASEYEVHPNQISSWKKQLLTEGASVFSRNGGRQQQEQTAREAELYEQIGRLKMELEWLKKKLPPSVEMRRVMIEPTHTTLSIRRQCDLLGLNRGTFYYQPAGETTLNLALMRVMDAEYTRTPFYGYRQMTARLQQPGYAVNRQRVQRLMGKMGLQAIYPAPRTSISAPQHKKYPYLLRDVTLTQPNQVWSADITYVPRRHGFMYLVAIMDWYSRFVLAWQLSNTLDGLFCLEVLRLALQQGQPEIFNTDQGCSSPPTSSPASWKRIASRLAWMGGGGSSITSSSNACGAVSSTSTSICMTMKRFRLWRWVWASTSICTIMSARTRA
jgi:putative transposase